MKKPYLNDFERKLIYMDTLNGACIMLRFRWKQFEISLIESPLGSIFYKFLHNVIVRFNAL